MFITVILPTVLHRQSVDVIRVHLRPEFHKPSSLVNWLLSWN